MFPVRIPKQNIEFSFAHSLSAQIPILISLFANCQLFQVKRNEYKKTGEASRMILCTTKVLKTSKSEAGTLFDKKACKKIPSKHTVSGYNWPVSETPFEWRFA